MARRVNEEPYCPGWAANVGAIPQRLNIRGILLSTMDINWHEFLIADFKTGTLIWKERSRDHFPNYQSWKTWNTKNAGKVAGSKSVRGYHVVKMSRKLHRAHRILWEMANGPIPKGLQIDHIDQNKGNNSRGNLRLATNAENQRNRRLTLNSTTGAKGVCLDKRSGLFYARIMLNRECIYLGTYHSIEDAAASRRAAELKYHGEFAPR